MTAEPAFDELIHAPVRLSIMALVAPTTGVEFRYVRDALDISDSVLSKHVRILEEAGYVRIDKENLGGGLRRTWLGLTVTGAAAFHAHVAALDQLLHPDRRAHRRV